MGIHQRPLGMVPSPKDHRDYRLASVTTVKKTFPAEYTFPNLVPVPYDQGDVGACVAFSLKAIKEMQESKERGEFTNYSAAYIYGARDADDYQGEGMIPREALDILRKRGDCRDELFPGIFPYPVCARNITPELNKDALPQRIKTYTAVHTVEEVKTALIELGPLSVGLQVYDSFYQGGNLPLPNQSTEKLHGYHMITIVGWTKENRWLVLNSWGRDWGSMKGYCTIPFDYPIQEIWAITDMVAKSSPDYEVYITQGMRFWTVRLAGQFRSSAEAQDKLVQPLINDLSQLGIQMVAKIRR